MKQRKHLGRSTPLKATGGLKRTTGLSSSGPTKPRHRKNTGPKRTTKNAAYGRFGGRCARCGRLAESLQHRKPRQMGGRPDPAINNLSNLVAVCGELGTVGCHGEIESNRTQAYVDGYLVKDAMDPLLVPVLLWNGRRVLLTDDGGYHEHEGEEAA